MAIAALDGHSSAAVSATFAPRKRIVDAVLSAPQRLHLFCAPAGYGKSCLIDEIERRVTHGGATTQRIRPSTNQQSIETASKSDFVLIDDAGDMHSLSAIARLAMDDGGPRVIMAARARPAIETARLELQAKLRVWTYADLRCDTDDVLTLLENLQEPAPPRTICHEIAQKAEGWIAGAKFLALQRVARRHNSRGNDAAASLEAYFYETILRPLPEAQRNSLRLASICDELCVPLFECITGRTDLAAIAEAGALLFPSQEREGWWRFHRLFRKYLARSAQTLGQEVLARAHRAAATWRLAAGTPTEAAAHALEGGDTRFAAEIIERGARAFIANGQISEALAWLDQLPVVEHGERPRIRLFYVTALATAGRLEEAECANEDLLSQLHAPGTPPGRADEITAHARFHRELIDLHRCPEQIDLHRIETLLEDTFQKQRTVYGEALLLKGAILHRQGDFDRARAAILDSLTHVKASASWYALIVGQTTLAQIDYDRGNTQLAEERCASLIDDIMRWTDVRVPATAPAAIMLARLAYTQDDLDAAAGWLSEAADLLPALQSPEWEFEHKLHETRLLCAQGDWDAGLQLSETVQGLAQHLRLPIATARAKATAARIHIELGDYEAARRRIEDARTEFGDTQPKSAWRAREHVASMLIEHRLALAQGSGASLAVRTADTLNLARRTECVPTILQALLLHATALHEGGDDTKAFRALREALKAGEKSRNVRVFLDFSDAAFQQLLAAYRRKRSVQHTADAIWLSTANKPGGNQGRDVPLVRSAQPGNSRTVAATDLTPKELEVLQLAAEGRNNQDIAEELFISIATVKWHIGNILSKLHASNRSAAIARARQLRLLL